MMAGAGLMVKLVMITLLIFSVVSWWIIIMKQMLFKRVRNTSEEFLTRFWESKTLNDAYESLQRSIPEARKLLFLFPVLTNCVKSVLLAAARQILKTCKCGLPPWKTLSGQFERHKSSSLTG